MTQPAGKEVRNSTKTKRALHILLKIIVAVVIVILLFIATVYTVNKSSSHAEQKRMRPYGQHVAVCGKQMNVFIHGQGEETIVILPGYGTAAPALDYLYRSHPKEISDKIRGFTGRDKIIRSHHGVDRLHYQK